MPRILHLVGLSFAAAASAGANCTTGLAGTNIGASCTSCVTTGSPSVSVCSAAYTATLLPTCSGCTLCPSTPPATPISCNICVGVGLVSGTGVCVATTSNVGFALTSQAALDFAGNKVDLTTAFSGAVATTIDDKVNGTVAAASSIVTLTSSSIANVNVGAPTTSSVAIFEVNSGTTTVTAWNNNAAAAKIDNSAALTINSLVTGNSFFSVWHNASAASSASVTFNSIDFTARSSFGNAYGSGIVHVSGGSVVVNASGVKATGTLKVTGGASVSTSASSGSLPATLTIDISAQGTSSPIAVVEAATVLDVSGDITSDGDKGVLAVNGQLKLGSTARADATTYQVRPKVIVNKAATVTINAASAFHATAVSVAQDATLQFNASAQAAAQAGTVVIDKIDLVTGSIIQINLAVSASVFASSMAGGAIAFNYSASNNVADLAKSTVQVVDSTGARVTLTSTTSASASTGRRLLATSNTATWGSNGMSYQMTGQSSGALPSCIVMPALAMSFLSLLL